MPMPIDSTREPPLREIIDLSKIEIFRDPYRKQNQDTLDLFEPTQFCEPVKYPILSLKELYAKKDSLKDLSASELIHFWKNLGAEKEKSDKSYEGFLGQAKEVFFPQKQDEYYYDHIVPKLCDEVTKRFLSGRGVKSGSDSLVSVLNPKLTQHIYWKIFEQGDHMFECYRNAKLSGMPMGSAFSRQLFENDEKD